MTKEKILEKINELLKTDFDLSFLLKLSEEEIKTLVASIRARLEQMND